MSAMRAQRGIALVLTLWLTVLLTAIAGGFAYSMHTEAIAAGNAIGVARVRAAADGAIERTVYELAKPRVPGAWLANGAAHAWKDGEIDLSVIAVDETAKIDLNGANEILLRGLFTQIGGVDADTAAHLVDALIDWRDPDDFRRPNGAESADYQAAGAKVLPANAPFETIGEVSRVLGMTPAGLRAHRPEHHRLLAHGGHQPAHRVARRAARASQRRPGRRRRVPDAARGRPREQPAAAALSGRRGIRDRRDPDVADSRRGEASRWCNLRPRSGGEAIAGSGAAARRARMARGRVRAARQGRRDPREQRCRPTVASRWARPPRRSPDSRARPGSSASGAGGRASSRRSCPRARATRSRAAAAPGPRVRRQRRDAVAAGHARRRDRDGNGDDRSARRRRAGGRRGRQARARRRRAQRARRRGRRAARAHRDPVARGARRTLTLPAAVEESLRQAVGYDLDRLTPFKADELYYDAVVAAREPAQGTIRVDFAAVRRPIVDAAIAHAIAWGAQVRGVSPDDPAIANVSRLNLAPDELRTVPAPWKRWQFWVPIGALALVALTRSCCRCGRSASTRSRSSTEPSPCASRPRSRSGCAPSSSARPATTTSRSSASTSGRRWCACSTR
jgi:hypothetical protein